MRKRLLVSTGAVALALAALGGLAKAVGDGQGDGAAAAGPKKPAWPDCGTGPLAQVQDLGWMEGTWDMAIIWYAPAPSTQTYTAPATKAVIEPMLSGSFLKETVTVPMGAVKNNLVGVRSFDRFRAVYRLVWFDDLATLADVYEGPMVDGTIVMTNIKAGTSYMAHEESETFGRITQRAGKSKDEFSLLWEASSDGGKTWARTSELKYVRKK